MIYFARMRWTQLIKIGCTKRDIRHRIKELESEYGYSFKLLAVTRGSFARERSLHWRFYKYRARKGRWWVLSKRELYYPRRELLEFIDREAKKLTKGGKR